LGVEGTPYLPLHIFVFMFLDDIVCFSLLFNG
jgi:hypothetical protein